MPLFTVLPAINGEAQSELRPAGFEIVNVGSVCVNRNNANPEETTSDSAIIPRIERVVSFLMLIFIC